MLRQFLIVTAAAGMIGCSSSATVFGPSSNERSEMAAYAASAKYPTMTPKTDWNVGTLVGTDSVTLVNYTDTTLHNVNVWINGSFVSELDVLPAHGSAKIAKARFYDRTGTALSDLTAAATKVTIQQGDSVYATLGPAMQ